MIRTRHYGNTQYEHAKSGDRFDKMRMQTLRNLVVAQRAANQRGASVHSVFLGTDADGLATYRLA